MLTPIYIVEVIERDTGRVAYRSKPTYSRRADKIEAGLRINLNHDKFDTRVRIVRSEEASADA